MVYLGLLSKISKQAQREKIKRIVFGIRGHNALAKFLKTPMQYPTGETIQLYDRVLAFGCQMGQVVGSADETPGFVAVQTNPCPGQYIIVSCQELTFTERLALFGKPDGRS